MDTRIQFRVDEETKRLAQQMAEQKRQTLSHESWLTEQVNLAFKKYDSGISVFVEHQTAKSCMEERKTRIRDKAKR